MRMTPRRFFDGARSGWRASMASSCFSASGNLPASNARYAVLYISSSSALVGATLSAANEVSPSASTPKKFQIFMNHGFKPRLASLTSRNCVRCNDFQFGSEKRFLVQNQQMPYCGLHPSRRIFRRLIQLPHDPQSFESQVRMNHRDLRHLASDKARITASCDDGNFLSRKLLRFDSRQNL